MNLQLKFRLLERLQNELENHVWDVFKRYIDAKSILFSHPETWTIEGESIVFRGEDGCKGCYDNKEIHVPMCLFVDTENAFKQLQDEQQSKKQKDEEAKQAKLAESELKELARLQQKYAATP